MKLAALALTLALTAPLTAQTFTDPANIRGERVNPTDGHELPVDQGPTGLAQLLRKLNTRASILNIVAHPDDEDGGMLTLYSRGFGARVTDLSLTRGEGGQNFMTGDFEDALGLIRTQELLANDRYTGVQQLFGTEVDFGFSKTKEEAFAKWTHDRVLYDAVRAIRLVRPLVITATFVGGVTDGHGQHQVSGEIAQEAFVAAADPNVFPDQIAEGLLPWQALRVYARVPFADVNAKGVFDYATGQYVAPHFVNYVTGKVSTTKPNADVVVPEGTPDPLLTAASANPQDLPANATTNTSDRASNAAASNTPFSYAQFSRIGLFLQRSQIGKSTRLPTAGIYDSGYTLYGSVLCNDPAKARPSSLAPKTCHPEQAPSVRSTNSQVPRGFSPQLSTNSQVPRGFSLGSHGPSAESGFSPQLSSNSQVPRGFSLGSHGPSAESGFSPQLSSNSQVPRGFSLGSHGSSAESGFSPQGMPFSSAPPDSVILSEAARASASSAAEGPATKPASPQPSAPFSPTALTTQPNFFTGIDTSIMGLQQYHTFPTELLPKLAGAIDSAIQNFDPSHPEKIAPALADALKTDDELINFTEKSNADATQKANALHELRIKRVQLNNALILSLGVTLDGSATQTDWVAGSAVSVSTTLRETSPAPLADIREFIANIKGSGLGDGSNSGGGPTLTSTNPSLRKLDIAAPNTDQLTEPYFYRDNIEQPTYKLRNRDLRNAPQSPPALYVGAKMTYQGVDITVSRVVHNGTQPLSIIPPVSIAALPTATVLPNGQTTAQLTATLRTDANTPANINVQSPHNWSIEAKAAGPNSVNFLLHPTAPLPGPQLFHVTAQTPDHHTYTEGFRTVGYPGLIATNYYTPSTTRVVPVDLKLPQHVRIAYLPGTGDAVPEALASIGLAPTMIKVADLTPAKLANYDTVILGVRAYTANPDLHGAPSQALLDFARNGGNVLVQYETSGLTSADTPYPLSLGSAEKVVDETAPVQLLSPTNPLLTTPNQITSADFNSWIAERGHGFLDTFDPRYTPLTETHDPGGPETAVQLPQRGGLITTSLGKGRWTYCAFALYRQLPEAVPGSFRLFVNLLTPAH